MSDILDQKEVIARKIHKCNLCGLGIKAGEKYLRINSVDEGDFSRCKYHLECIEMTRIWKWDQMDWEMGEDYATFREEMTKYKNDLNKKEVEKDVYCPFCGYQQKKYCEKMLFQEKSAVKQITECVCCNKDFCVVFEMR